MEQCYAQYETWKWQIFVNMKYESHLFDMKYGMWTFMGPNIFVHYAFNLASILQTRAHELGLKLRG